MLPAKLSLRETAFRQQRKLLPPKPLLSYIALWFWFHDFRPLVDYNLIEQRLRSNCNHAVRATLSLTQMIYSFCVTSGYGRLEAAQIIKVLEGNLEHELNSITGF